MSLVTVGKVLVLSKSYSVLIYKTEFMLILPATGKGWAECLEAAGTWEDAERYCTVFIEHHLLILQMKSL